MLKKIILNQYFWLAIILFLGFIFRFYKIDNPIADWHSWRQADTASVTRIYVEYGINPLIPRYYDISSIQSGFYNPNGYRFVEFPLYNIIHALLVKTFGGFSLEMWGRLLSLLCSLFSGFLIFLIGKKYLGKVGGLLTTFFYLFLPYNIFFSRVILPEPMANCLALLALWLFIKHLEKKDIFNLLLSAISFVLALLVKPHTIFYAVPMLYLFFGEYKVSELFDGRKLFVKYLLFMATVLLPFLLWRSWENNFPAGIPLMDWAFNGDMIRFRPAFWRWIFAERLGRMILGIWGIFPFVIGIIWSKSKKHLIFYLLLGMFLYVSVFATANVRHDYYQYFIIPAVALALAQGSIYILTSENFNKWLSYPILLFSVFMMLGTSFYQIKDFYQINHPELIEAGAAVDKLTPKDAKVIAPYNGDTAFLYQTKRFGWPVVDTSLKKLIDERGADYFISVNFSDPDTIYLKKNYKVVEETKSYILIDLHQPQK